MKTPAISFAIAMVAIAITTPVFAGGRGHGAPQGFSRGTAAARPNVSAIRPGSAVHFNGGQRFATSRQFSNFQVNRSFPHQQFSGQSLQRPAGVTPRFGMNQARNFTASAHQHHGDSAIARGGNRLAGANNHVFARHAANWHSDWDRHHDHWSNGHRCHFFNGSWVVFDVGFAPWWGYPYSYPYDYYYPPYPYSYDYGNGDGYNNEPAYEEQQDSQIYDGKDVGAYDDGQQQEEAPPTYYYNSSARNTDSDVASAQERLSRHGYYRGEIDGVLGPSTQRAIARYQRDSGLRVTGTLTSETLRSLDSQRVARY